MNSLSEPNAFYSESFTGFSAPPPPFMSQPPQQRYLKEITTDSSTSRRSMLNEIPLSTSSNVDEVTSTKTNQLNDLSSNGNILFFSSLFDIKIIFLINYSSFWYE